MCHQVSCRICSRPTWSGCGNHIETALAGIPRSQRCPGHDSAEIAQYKAENGLIKRLFGRG